MAVLFVTKDKGGLSRPAEMTVVLPSQQMPLQALQQIAPGIDQVFLADMLSAFAMHNRAAARLSRAAAEQSSMDELRDLHESLARKHIEHLTTLEALMQVLGLDPLYASPAARMAGYRAEGLMEAPLLAGSVDPTTMELALVEVGLALAEMDDANTQALAAIAARTQPSAAKNALEDAIERLDVDDTTTLDAIRTARRSLVVAGALGHRE